MTADGPAVLAAVLDAPADDAPRLVYADWLEENATADHVGPCPECGGKPRHKLVTRNGEEYRYEQIVCKCAWRRFAVPGNGYAERAEFIRRQVAEPWGSIEVFPHDRGAALYGMDHTTVLVQLPPNVGAVFNRGFVAEVRGPLAVLVGGPCLGCVGSGIRGHEVEDASGEVDWAASPCPACSGSGRTPGVLARLAREQPVEVVTITDRTMYEHADGWTWWLSHSHDSPGAVTHWLPSWLTPHFPKSSWRSGRRYNGKRGEGYVEWKNKEAAIKATTAALLEHARQLAGRPATA
jgi:uncharacterized protein (TIGR02996 family)